MTIQELIDNLSAIVTLDRNAEVKVYTGDPDTPEVSIEFLGRSADGKAVTIHY